MDHTEIAGVEKDFYKELTKGIAGYLCNYILYALVFVAGAFFAFRLLKQSAEAAAYLEVQ